MFMRRFPLFLNDRLAHSLTHAGKRAAAVLGVDHNLQDARGVAFLPSRVEGGIEFAFGANEIAFAAADKLWQFVEVPMGNVVELPIAGMEQSLGAVAFVIQDDDDGRKLMPHEVRK